MEVGVDGDHVDLAERRVVRRRGPSSSRSRRGGRRARASRKPSGSNHGSRLAGRAASSTVQPPWSGCQCEGPVVDREPGLLVAAGHERAGGQRRAASGRAGAAGASGAASRPGRSPAARRWRRARRRLEHPPVDVPAAVAATTRARRRAARGRWRRLVAVVRVDDELECPASSLPRRPGRRPPGGRAGSQATRPAKPGDRRRRGRATRGRQRAVAVGALGAVEQLDASATSSAPAAARSPVGARPAGYRRAAADA